MLSFQFQLVEWWAENRRDGGVLHLKTDKGSSLHDGVTGFRPSMGLRFVQIDCGCSPAVVVSGNPRWPHLTLGLVSFALHMRRVVCLLATIGACQYATAKPPGHVTSKTVVYTTGAGDTLYNLAERYLLGANDWRLLAQLNDLPGPKRLQPGLALKLPVTRLRKEQVSARVLATQGPTERALGNTYVPLVVNATLNEGDHVRTGSTGFVSLELSDGSHVSLPPDSELDLSTLRRTLLTGTLERQFDLKRGAVDSEVTHMKKRDDRFQIRSPSVVAGVRGTHFRVSYDVGGTEATRIEVLAGAVGVAGRKRLDAATLVQASYGSIAASDGTVGAPIPLLSAPTLVKPGKVQDDPEVTFELAPLANAHTYHVQLAHDAGLLDLFGETRTDTTHAVFRDVPNGTFFVRIAAIDENGLEGMPRTYAFERRQMGLNATATLGGDGYVFRWSTSGVGANAHYRFILSKSKNLRAPVVDQIGLTEQQITIAHLPPGEYFWAVIIEEYVDGRFYEKTGPVNTLILSP